MIPPIIATALARAAGVAILDFEASCLPEPGSYPLEVGACICKTGEVASWMIRPTAAWLETGVWDTDAEAIHGITREQAVTEGQPPSEVLAALVEFVGDRDVLSDSPSAEEFWLRRLAAAAGRESPFAVGDLDSLLTTISTDRDEIEQTREVAAGRFPGIHRAGADARHLAEMVRILAGLDDERVAGVNPRTVAALRYLGVKSSEIAEKGADVCADEYLASIRLVLPGEATQIPPPRRLAKRIAAIEGVDPAAVEKEISGGFLEEVYIPDPPDEEPDDIEKERAHIRAMKALKGSQLELPATITGIDPISAWDRLVATLERGVSLGGERIDRDALYDRLRQDGPEADFDFDPPKIGNEVPERVRQIAEELLASVEHSMRLEGQEVKNPAARERLLAELVRMIVDDDHGHG